VSKYSESIPFKICDVHFEFYADRGLHFPESNLEILMNHIMNTIFQEAEYIR